MLNHGRSRRAWRSVLTHGLLADVVFLSRAVSASVWRHDSSESATSAGGHPGWKRPGAERSTGGIAGRSGRTTAPRHLAPAGPATPTRARATPTVSCTPPAGRCPVTAYASPLAKGAAGGGSPDETSSGERVWSGRVRGVGEAERTGGIERIRSGLRRGPGWDPSFQPFIGSEGNAGVGSFTANLRRHAPSARAPRATRQRSERCDG